MAHHQTRMTKEGRVLIPAELRKSLGFTEDEPLSLYEHEGGVLIVSRRQAIRQMQRRMARLKKPGESVVDELLRERRAEGSRE